METLRRRLVVQLFLALSISFTAQAGLIDFESPAVSTCFNTTCNNVQGYNFTFSAGGWGIVTNHSNSFFNYNSSGGLLGAHAGGSPTLVTMTLSGGGAFSLLALDAATGAPSFAGNTSIVVTGNLQAGGTVQQTLTASTAWLTYTLSGFTNLSSIVFSNQDSSAGLSLDNLTDQPSSSVPEPATASLVVLALSSFLLMRRQRSLQKRQ